MKSTSKVQQCWMRVNEEEGSKWGREEWKGKRGYQKILKNILGIFESF